MEYIPSLISTIVQHRWCPKSASQLPWLWCGYSTTGHPLPNSDVQPILLISYQFGFLLTNLSAIMTHPKPQTSEVTLSNDEKLLAAMDCYRINTKVSIRALAKCFGVARTTLQDWIHGAISCAEEMNSQCQLSPTETRVLAEHAITMQKLHFPLTPQDIRNEAQHLWHSKNKLAEAQDEMIGVNWYFWEITLRWPIRWERGWIETGQLVLVMLSLLHGMMMYIINFENVVTDWSVFIKAHDS